MSDLNQQPFGFQTTQWSLVIDAGNQVGATENRLLGELCERYWRPLYLFVRRSGKSSESAEDAVQGFFLQLLTGQSLRIADPTRGRFRTFLLASLTNYLHNQHSKETTLKRGGSARELSLDIRDAEGVLVNQPSVEGTPEEEFDRQWAISVLNSALGALRERYGTRAKLQLYDSLSIYLSSESPAASYEQTAKSLDMTPAAVKVAVHRMRREYRNELRKTVAATLQSADEVEDELNILLNALNPRR